MKKTKTLLPLTLLGILSGALVGCGKDSNKIVVWVGEESAAFYTNVVADYLETNPDFGFEVEVKGMDTGTIAGVITNDPEAAADIYTVAHDNVGKLAATQCAKPLTEATLTAQILADNPDAFKSVIYNKLGNQDMIYASPYISQALVLFYNKAYVSAEQAKSFEGLSEAAAAISSGTKKVHSVTFTGDDGYNFSITTLARKVSDKSTSVKIYEGANSDASTKDFGTSYFQGDDTVAVTRWAQDSFASENGLKWASSDGWEADLRNEGVLGVISGSWNYNAAAACVGETNLGIALIPTMTITASQAEGLTDVAEGDVFRGGTFADCKCFMINGYSAAKKYSAEQALIKYLSSKDIQNLSYKEALNIPAYEGANDYINSLYVAGEIEENQYLLAAKQVEMAEWGIPQPFINGTLNTYFYSKNAPAVLRAIVDRAQYPVQNPILEETTSLAGIRKGLWTIQYIWMRGYSPERYWPETYPAAVPTAAEEKAILGL